MPITCLGKTCFASALCLLLTFSGGGAAYAQATVLSLDSEAGDYIGGGRHLQFTQADGTFIVQRNVYNGVSIQFSTPTFDHFWFVDFAAPGSQPLTAGFYPGARRFPFQAPGEPGLDVSGDGRGCNTLTGTFEIREVTFGFGSDVVAFAATFVQHCEGAGPALRGEVRFNADLPVLVAAPLEKTVEVGALVTFTVSATQSTAGTPALRATGLPAGAAFTDHSDGTGTFTWTPGLTQVGPHIVAFDAHDGQGGTGRATTLVTVVGSTVLILDSEPGDYVGGGQHLVFRLADGTFRVSGNSRSGVSIQFSGPAHLWFLDFAAPAGQPLAVGTYPGAQRFPFQDAGKPGLSVDGDGRGCNTLTGSFEIKEVTYGSGSDVLVFWATFEQHCDGAGPALRGEVRFNADLSVFVVAPIEKTVEVGTLLTFTVSATQLTAGVPALTATGLPAEAVFADRGDGTATFRWTPSVAQAGAYTIEFDADDGQGGTGSATTLVRVFGHTALMLRSQPGDYVGGGQSLVLSPADGEFHVFRNFDGGVSVQFEGPAHFWFLDFAAPGGQPLAVGTYQGAQRFPFQDAGKPGLDVAGDGRGCNTLTGSFEIVEVVYGPNDTVASFRATFEQHCEGALPALLGEIRFNANVAPSDTLADVWIGLRNSDDVGLRVDLQAEVFVKGGTTETRVGHGQLDNQPGGSSGFTNAMLRKVAMSLTEGSLAAPPGALLELKLSVRRTCSGSGHGAGTVRLWYNAGPIDRGSSREAGSRLVVNAGGSSADYFLREGSALSRTAGSSRLFIDRFVDSRAPCPARPFTPFGTWSLALP